METASPQGLTAFVLAGGKSTRMGSDKAFVTCEGRTLLARALELTRSITPDVHIVGNRKKFAAFAPVVEDIFRDHGPLAGIHAALRRSRNALNLMLAVDMPFVSNVFLKYLVRQARDAHDSVVVVPDSGGRRQPLCAIYHPEFAAVAENALRTGRNRIDRLFNTVRTRILEEEELKSAGFPPAIFCNLNTPQELQEVNARTTGTNLNFESDHARQR